MLSTLLLEILSMLHFGPVGHGGLGSCEKESLLHLLCILLPGCCTCGAGRSANQAVGRAHAPRACVVNQVVGASFECSSQQGGVQGDWGA